MQLTTENIDSLTFDPNTGLLPAIAQDADSGEIRMLGWMNRNAVAATLERDRAVFWSRQRQCLWEKGATSGHRLDVLSVHTDCDRDTLLLRVKPQGPTCHTGDRSCFGLTPPIGVADGFLTELERVIASRAEESPTGASVDRPSYTARLIASGVARIAQKVGEEAVEVALASTGADDDALVGEVADLMYHLLVLLRARGLGLSDVALELQRRHADAKG